MREHYGLAVSCHCRLSGTFLFLHFLNQLLILALDMCLSFHVGLYEIQVTKCDLEER
jgi:hypothetical protein